jgi:hypothetical protein
MGGFETRIADVSTDISWLQENHDWPGLKAIGKVKWIREAPDKTWQLDVVMNEVNSGPD